MKWGEFIILNMVLTSMFSRLWWVRIFFFFPLPPSPPWTRRGSLLLSCTDPLIAPSLHQGDFPWHPVLPVSAVRASPATSKGSGQQSAHALPQGCRPAGMCGWLPGSFWRPDADCHGAHCFSSCQSQPAAAEKDTCSSQEQDEETGRPRCRCWKRYGF